MPSIEVAPDQTKVTGNGSAFLVKVTCESLIPERQPTTGELCSDDRKISGFR
jgi:hypothetical protein